jgi:sucrose-6-phosphate hydrolase SacC (GH32 family)
MRYLFFLIPALILLSSAKPDKNYYAERLRPQYHFTPEKNWMNDPNGLVFYDGEYHLFYQHNPFGNEWGFMHWGHAVSTDLVHWDHLPIAITPDEGSTDTSRCTAFSGSAVVDENNSTGLQKGEDKTLLIFYTSQKCGQRLAYSNDKGRTWTKYEKNPIIPFQDDDARDPKVFYHQPSGKWIMVLYRHPGNDESKQGISIYNSSDLLQWELQSHVEGYFECPDLFELPLDGKTENKKWAMLGGDGAYQIGSFDGKTFVPETKKIKLDYGGNFYATQTWSNQPDEKVIQIAWMRGGEYPGMPFNGQMSFPTELSLRTTTNGPTICRKPIAAISSVYSNTLKKADRNYIPGLKNNMIGSTKGDAFHIKAIFTPKTSDNFGFVIRSGKKSNGTEVRYETAKKMLYANGRQMEVEQVDGKIKMEILIDRSSIEVFCNDGEKVITSCFVPEEGDEDITLYTQGGELYINELEVNKIRSAWVEKEK